MATQWAGDFSCGTCGQKRLTAAAFSKKQLEKRSKDLTASIKCKQCVDAAAEKERADASARAAKKAAEEAGAPMDVSDSAGAAAAASGAAPAAETLMCSACEQVLAASAFSKAQQGKGDKRRCLPCVAKAEKDEAGAATERRTEQLEAAREALKKIEASGTASAVEVAKAFAKVSALEGQQVTGIKPMVLGRGRGRSGRGRGGGK